MGMSRGRLFAALAVIVFGAIVFVRPVLAADVYTITVEGAGKVTAVPDKVQIVCSVSAESKEIDQAVALQAEKVSKFLDGLRGVFAKKNLDPKDVATLGYDYQPIYEYPDNKRVFVGYKVNQHFRVQTLVDKTGPVLARVTREAFVDNVQFVVSDTGALMEQAVNLAIDDAKNKASRRAVKLGVKLGAILGYQESTNVPNWPRRHEALDVVGVAREPQLPVDETEVTVRVLITYELVFESIAL